MRSEGCRYGSRPRSVGAPPPFVLRESGEAAGWRSSARHHSGGARLFRADALRPETGVLGSSNMENVGVWCRRRSKTPSWDEMIPEPSSA